MQILFSHTLRKIPFGWKKIWMLKDPWQNWSDLTKIFIKFLIVSTTLDTSFSIFMLNRFTYRIDVIWTPLLNRTPPIKNSNTTPVKYLYLGQKLVKSGPNLNWAPPKNPFWKIEPWGCIEADTVIIHSDALLK